MDRWHFFIYINFQPIITILFSKCFSSIQRFTLCKRNIYLELISKFLYIREMYQVRDGFCFSAISLDSVNISSSYKDQIKAHVFAQVLSHNGILISYTEQKNNDHFRSDVFRTKKFLAPATGHLQKSAKYGKILSKNTINKENVNFYNF